MGKVLRKMKEKNAKSKGQRHGDKPQTSGPVSNPSPDGVGPHGGAQGQRALDVEDDDPFMAIGDQEAKNIQIGGEDGEEDEADEDPWEFDQHSQTPFADNAT